MRKVSLLGVPLDNAALSKICNCKVCDLTFLIELMPEVFFGKPLLGPGCRRAALSVICALALLSVIPLGPQLSQVIHDRASEYLGATQEDFDAIFPLIFIDPRAGNSYILVGGSC